MPFLHLKYTSVGPAAVPASVVRAVRDAGSAREVWAPLRICILVLGVGDHPSQALLKISLSQALISQLGAARDAAGAVGSVPKADRLGCELRQPVGGRDGWPRAGGGEGVRR